MKKEKKTNNMWKLQVSFPSYEQWEKIIQREREEVREYAASDNKSV
jgi:hypothetical protein